MILEIVLPDGARYRGIFPPVSPGGMWRISVHNKDVSWGKYFASAIESEARKVWSTLEASAVKSETKQHDAPPSGSPTSDLRPPISDAELIPAPKRGVGRPANYLQIVGTRSMPERIEKIKEYHASGMAALGQGAMYIILTGFELLAVRATIGHGGWENWVETNCPFSVRTARRYTDVAERKYKDIPNLSHVSDFALGVSPHLLEAGQRQQLIDAVKDATDGETTRQLYLELGLIKGPPASTATSGPKGPQTPEDKCKRKEELLIAYWGQWRFDLKIKGVDHKTWANLPHQEMDQLLEVVEVMFHDLKRACQRGR